MHTTPLHYATMHGIIVARKRTGKGKGKDGMFGRLVVDKAPLPTPPTTIAFGRKSGLNAGLPIVGEALQVFIDKVLWSVRSG